MSKKTFFAATPARAKMSVGEAHETYAIFSFYPPEMDNSKRPPLDLSVALDVSGSMSGDKLETAKRSLLKLVEHLTEQDRLSVVTFDTHVSTVCTPDTMSPDAKRSFTQKIKALRAGSSTNLSGGLLQSLALLREGPMSEATVQRCMLFTDGQANVGIRDPQKLTETATEFRERIGISTFGYGRGHDAELLQALALDGDFYYIDNPDRILTAFGAELGGLLSTYAQNIKLRLEPDEGVEIVEVMNDVTVTEDGNVLSIECDDLLAGVPQHIVLRLKFDPREKGGPRAIKLVTGSVEYMDVEAAKIIKETTSLKVQFVKPEKADTEDDKTVLNEVALQMVVNAQQQAILFAEAGNMEAARGVLKTARDYSCFVGTDISKGLGDLAGALENEVYADHGTYAANSYSARSVAVSTRRKAVKDIQIGDMNLMDSTALGNNLQREMISHFAGPDDPKASGGAPGFVATGNPVGVGVANVAGLTRLVLDAGSVSQGKDIKNNDDSPGDSSSVSKTRSDRW